MKNLLLCRFSAIHPHQEGSVVKGRVFQLSIQITCFSPYLCQVGDGNEGGGGGGDEGDQA